MFNSGLDEARVNAYSQVHGNTYGIITNSTAAKIMYGIENEYRIKSQHKERMQNILRRLHVSEINLVRGLKTNGCKSL